ncbi:MAG TPA: hypothetical protein VMU08_18865 [Rhizomicrobium sp.]|nr:hypothetical protein [Rhizomicrobium sp.]
MRNCRPSSRACRRAVQTFAGASILAAALAGQSFAGSIDCIEAKGIRSITAVDASTLKVTMFSRMIYRNAVSGKCIVHRAGHFTYRAENGQLCSGATIGVAGTGTSCTLGKFEEISPRNR